MFLDMRPLIKRGNKEESPKQDKELLKQQRLAKRKAAEALKQERARIREDKARIKEQELAAKAEARARKEWNIENAVLSLITHPEAGDCWFTASNARVKRIMAAGLPYMLWRGVDGQEPLLRVSVRRHNYEKHIGPIPPNMCVISTCKRFGCVNPEHAKLQIRSRRQS